MDGVRLEMLRDFATAFTRARKRANRTQEWIAEQLNYSPQAISEWVNLRSQPSPATVRRIEDLLHCERGELGRHLDYAEVPGEESRMALEAFIMSEPTLSPSDRLTLVNLARRLQGTSDDNSTS